MDETLQMLLDTELFAGTREDELRSMMVRMNAVTKNYPQDAYILRAGEISSAMGLVLCGSVLLIQEDLWGRRNIMGQAGPGAVFAETFAAAGCMPLNVSAVASTPCRVLFLDIHRVLTVCPSACGFHTRVVANLVSVMAKKVMTFNEKITHMSKKTTREKLLSYLSSEALRQRTLEFCIPFDRQQLADYLCVDRAAMCAELSRLQKEGFLEYKRNHFRIHSSTAEVL